MTNARDEQGFTLIELLVTIALLSVVISGFLSVMLSGARSSDTTQSVVRISEEARLGFNRMVRDVREADVIDGATPNSFKAKIDFNGDGTYANDSANGVFEDLEFRYAASSGHVLLNGEILMEGVRPVVSTDVFRYSSNLLAYDWNADGVTTWQELDQAPSYGVTGVGNGNGVLDSGESAFISTVTITLTIDAGGRTADFYAEVQVRNRR